MLIKISDVRDAIEEVWITLLWTKINKIWYLFRRFFWKWEHVQFRGFQSKKNENEEVKKNEKKKKMMLWLYIPGILKIG